MHLMLQNHRMMWILMRDVTRFPEENDIFGTRIDGTSPCLSSTRPQFGELDGHLATQRHDAEHTG